MALIFPRWTNKGPLAVAVALPLLLVVVVLAVWYWASPAYTDVGYQPRQPVPYSHRLHVGELGMDCRYCHNTVERAAFAAVPPSKTCMNCHHLILKDSPKLAPVRSSVASGKPVEWIRVHMLPNYAYFNHGAMVAAGVGCGYCHGRVDHMKVVHQEAPLSMGWCLDCHRDPLPNLRPPDQVTNMDWDPEENAYDPRSDPTRDRLPDPPTHCSGCHR